jgi:hypothetical protein
MTRNLGSLSKKKVLDSQAAIAVAERPGEDMASICSNNLSLIIGLSLHMYDWNLKTINTN